MDGDKFQKGFSLLLLGFVSSMILLIFRPNLFSLLLGWDGLGLVSYLLVIYYISYSSANAGMLTILMNRVGDVFFLFSISLLSAIFVWDYFVFNTQITFFISFLLVITFITKSAQVPFSS
jgi:NADH-ubiquinone oxidoreductase chain 5